MVIGGVQRKTKSWGEQEKKGDNWKQGDGVLPVGGVRVVFFYLSLKEVRDHWTARRSHAASGEPRRALKQKTRKICLKWEHNI